MKSFNVDGMATDSQPAASLITMNGEGFGRKPEVSDSKPLLTVVFETKPLDDHCDQRLVFRTHPITVIYHAPTINKLVEVFRPPESVALKQLTMMAMARYENIKQRSATGLEYALQHRTILKLDIELLPPLIVIPETGIYKE